MEGQEKTHDSIFQARRDVDSEEFEFDYNWWQHKTANRSGVKDGSYLLANLSFTQAEQNGNWSVLFGSGDDTYGAVPFDTLTRIILIILYGAVFACCTIGNLLVIVVVLRHRKMRTTTNFFLANLALADLSVGFFCVLPNLGLYLSPFWLLGKVMCKLLYFVQMMSYAASITILTVISVERYFAILHPFRCKQWKTLCLLRVVVVVVWSAAAVCGIPQLIFYSVVDLHLPPTLPDSGTPDVHLAFCIVVVRHNQQAYVTTNFVLWYVVPLVLMTVMYSRISVVLWRTSLNAVGHLANHSDSLERLPGTSRRNSSSRNCRQKKSKLKALDENSAHDTDANPSVDTAACAQEDAQCRVQNCAENCADQSSPTTTCCLLFVQKKSAMFSSCRSKTKMAVGAGCADRMELQSLVRRKKCVGPAPSCSGDEENTAQRVGCLRNGSAASSPTKDTLVKHGRLGATTRALLKNVRFHSEDGGQGEAQGALVARRRVIRLLIAVIVCFALCVLPYHVLMMWQTWRPTHQHQHPTPYGQLLAAPITFLIFYLNSALNPLLYAFLSDNFRRSLCELLRGGRTPALSSTARSTRRRSTLTSKTNQTSCV